MSRCKIENFRGIFASDKLSETKQNAFSAKYLFGMWLLRRLLIVLKILQLQSKAIERFGIHFAGIKIITATANIWKRAQLYS